MSLHGYDKSPDYGVKAPKGFARVQVWILGIIVLVALVGLPLISIFAHSKAKPDPVIHSIYWSDGDSGRINGSLKFRLNDVDAPETGGVGAAIGGAKCELERKLGYKAKAWAVAFTKTTSLEITQSHGTDRYGRLIVDIGVDGRDIGKAGITAGHYKLWAHDGRKALSKRPTWCKLNP